MGKVNQLTESERVLLNILGKNPDISMKGLVNNTPYKWESTVARKLNQLRENHILFGPSYYYDEGKLCKNPLHRVYCILETNLSYRTVISYLKMIEPLQLIYPVLSPHKNVLVSALLSSDDQKTESIFQLLKDHSIITDYSVRSSNHKRIMENPNLFGNSNPSLDSLLQPCDIPDLTAGEHDTSWNECDLSILRYFGIGGNGPKLIDILSEEKKLHKHWTYEQIKYSHEKMVKNNLIIRIYLVNPFPPSQCVHFLLFLKCEDVQVTQKILCNFAQGERIYKDYSLYGEWGMIICFSHHVFLMNLMSKLDKTEEISEKELYQLRAFPPHKYWMSRPPEFRYFDFEKQTLKYPYDLYVEKIKERIESEPEP